MKAIWINTPVGKIVEIDYDTLLDLQRRVSDREGRYASICLAGELNTDTLYINEDGLYIFDRFFWLPGCGQQLFAGPGVIIGKEIGLTSNTRSPKSTLAEVTSAVKFLDRNQARILANRLGI